jgi:uncharacterized protein YkwD
LLDSRLARLFFLFFLPSLVLAQTPVRNSTEPDRKEIEFLEWHCFEEVNRERKKNLLPPLEVFGPLVAIARSYSRRMAEEGFFSHTDPEGRTVFERVKESGIKFSQLAENLLTIKGYLNPVPPGVEQWMSSERHRLNILNPEYRYAAIGAWVDRNGTVYFTQIFVR